MAVVLPDISRFLLKTVDILCDVVSVLVFAFIVLFDVFGTHLDAAGHLVAGGVFADVAGILVDTVGRFVEGFAAVLSLHIKINCYCFC